MAILLRCIGSKNQVRNFVPEIATNKIRMAQMGFKISDPNEKEKVDAWKQHKEYQEKIKEPIIKK